MVSPTRHMTAFALAFLLAMVAIPGAQAGPGSMPRICIEDANGPGQHECIEPPEPTIPPVPSPPNPPKPIDRICIGDESGYHCIDL